jgi:hypothetical protein
MGYTFFVTERQMYITRIIHTEDEEKEIQDLAAKLKNKTIENKAD